MLTEDERRFLAAFIYEATTDPFKGPATEELHRRNIYYTDLSHLMTAYYEENPGTQEGFGGIHHPASPPCPWKDRDTAVRRGREVQATSEHSVPESIPEESHRLSNKSS